MNSLEISMKKASNLSGEIGAFFFLCKMAIDKLSLLKYYMCALVFPDDTISCVILHSFSFYKGGLFHANLDHPEARRPFGIV